jgi:hypothetical protein
MHLILLVKNTNKKGGNLGNIKKKRNQRKGKKNSTLGGWPHHGQESDFLVGIPVHGW